MDRNITNNSIEPNQIIQASKEPPESQQQALNPGGFSGSNDPFVDEFKSRSMLGTGSVGWFGVNSANNMGDVNSQLTISALQTSFGRGGSQSSLNQKSATELKPEQKNLLELQALKPDLSELMSGKKSDGSRGSFSKKKKASSKGSSFRKNMFSLKEDILILNSIISKGEKSERQVFRDLVIQMNRSDEALKTRYKSYLKPLNEVDKMLMRNKAKELNPLIHCAIIQTDKETKKRILRGIVKNETAGPPAEKVKPPAPLKGRIKKPKVFKPPKVKKVIIPKLKKPKKKEPVVLNEEDIAYLQSMSQKRVPNPDSTPYIETQSSQQVAEESEEEESAVDPFEDTQTEYESCEFEYYNGGEGVGASFTLTSEGSGHVDYPTKNNSKQASAKKNKEAKMEEKLRIEQEELGRTCFSSGKKQNFLEHLIDREPIVNPLTKKISHSDQLAEKVRTPQFNSKKTKTISEFISSPNKSINELYPATFGSNHLTDTNIGKRTEHSYMEVMTHADTEFEKELKKLKPGKILKRQECCKLSFSRLVLTRIRFSEQPKPLPSQNSFQFQVSSRRENPKRQKKGC